MPMDGKDGIGVGRVLHLVNIQREFGNTVQLVLPVTMLKHNALPQNRNIVIKKRNYLLDITKTTIISLY
ncbi:hypothetical protein D1872_308380 [compost metagenome]